MHTLDDIVTLDFETFYSSEYSLVSKKYNTSGYVRDPQFKAHCIGICDGRKEAVWYGPDDIKRGLKKYGVANRPMAAHNAAFDGFILAERYDIVCPFYYDTLAMSRGLHGTSIRHNLDSVGPYYGFGRKTEGLLKTKGIRDLPPELLIALGEYCCNDTELCRDVLGKQLAAMPTKELRLIDWIIRAFCNSPLMVDQRLAKEEYDYEVEHKNDKVVLAGVDIETLMSSDKLALAFEALGIDVPTKISPATGEITFAFSKQDKSFTDLLEHDDLMVRHLVEARLATKSTIGETRARRFMDMGNKPLPVGYNYYGAHTGRLSGNNKINLQNLESLRQGPARLRRSIIPIEGNHVIVVVDSAQIEARKNAWLWDQKHILEAFSEGKDVYKIQAAKTYGVPEIEVDKEQRFVGKVQILGLGFGMGWRKFQATLALGLMGPALIIDDDTAKLWVSAYRRVNDMIAAGWKKCDQIIVDMATGREGEYKCIGWEKDTLWLPNGMPLHYTGLHGLETAQGGYEFTYVGSFNGKRKKVYGGLLDENIVQALSRIIVTDQLLMVVDAGWNCAMTTHDELVSVCHKSQADRCLEEMTKIMRTPPAWCRDIPLGSDGGYDVCYSK